MADLFKIEDIGPETTSTKQSYTKNEEKIESVSMPNIQVPDYSYGNSQDTIDWAVSVRNITAPPKFAILAGTYPASTWNFSITWVWFQPVSIKLTSMFAGGTQSTWFAKDWVFEYVYSSSASTAWRWDYQSSEIVRIYDNTLWVNTIWAMVSFDTDWITINLNTATNVAYYTLECHG